MREEEFGGQKRRALEVFADWQQLERILLERAEPNALDGVRYQKKVLHRPKRCDIESDVHESHPDKSFVLLERTYENLLSHRVDEVTVDSAESSDGTFGFVATHQSQLELSSFAVGHDFNNLENVRLLKVR